MSTIELFSGGTPECPDEALRLARAALASGVAVTWYVEPANLALLTRVAGKKGEAAPPITVVLRAVDEAPDRCVVAHEGALVPALRRLHERGLALRLSTGRPYVLPPPALDISTNDLCGLECVMCKNRAPKRDPRTMTPADVRALLAEAAAWGIARVALTGAGEPFRDPEMLAYVRDANALGLRVGLTTNGFPVSEGVAAELAGRVVSVSVSIHGATPAMHDAIVGVPRASENAFKAVRRLVAARNAGPSKLLVNVSTVIQRANVGEIAALARWAREMGCDGFNVQPVNLQHGSIEGDTIKRRDDVQMLASLWPARADAEALAVMGRELAEIGRQNPRFLNTSEERLDLFQRYFDDSSRAALGVSCRVGETFLAVDHRGAIKPCYRLGWSHGDARLVSVRALWNSVAYAKTRAMIDTCPLTCMNNCLFRGPKKDADGAKKGADGGVGVGSPGNALSGR
jgi:MoaA/NifB/PqqE/SkfB family radical SAM enzyme